MLNELHIENIAVIEKADIEFGKGLNILTGKTGAGKSIVIDSIGAVLGERVSKELVRRGADKGVVTAVFDSAGAESWLEDNEIECDGELILQRRISADGKSSCRVCGAPVTAAQMKELASRLVDIHGQNDGRQLMDERNHREYLDRFGTPPEALEAFGAAYKQYNDILRELKSIEMDDIEKERLSDTLKYQIEELERAELKAGEYDALTARRDLLRNSEKLTEAIDQALSILDSGDESAINQTENARYFAQKAAAISPELDSAAESLESASFSLSNALEVMRDFRDSLDFSPEEYDALETRIAQLSKLQRKYNRDIDSLLDYLKECVERLDNIQYADERGEKLRRELTIAQKRAMAAAKELSGKRRSAAAILQERIVSELRQMNMPSVRFAVGFAPIDKEPGFDSAGCDEIRFVMSANAGEEMGRISRIASGGELSRIMLAMKNVFAANDPVPTMIFDEIDTGVSGIAAQRVGEKLFTVSLGKQVMAVTHLPQIAAMADNHYLIRKQEKNGRTYTEVEPVGMEGRRQEIARLHGGDNITSTTLASAQEQLDACRKFKATPHNTPTASTG